MVDDASSSRLPPTTTHRQPVAIITWLREPMVSRRVYHCNNNQQQRQQRQSCAAGQRKNKIAGMIGFNSSTLLLIIALLLMVGISKASKSKPDLTSDSEFLFDESDVNAMQEREFSKNNAVSPMSSPIVKSRHDDDKKSKKHHEHISNHRSNSSSHKQHHVNRKPPTTVVKHASTTKLHQLPHKKEQQHQRPKVNQVNVERHHDQKLKWKPVKKEQEKMFDDWSSKDQQQIDDEDYLGDIASGSGEPSTVEPDLKPVEPTLKPSKVIYYRMTINFVSLTYDDELSSRDSLMFQNVSDELVRVIEPLYDDVPGQQVITIVKFSPATVGCLVTTDLGTVDYYDEPELKDVILKRIKRRAIDNYEVAEEGFTFRTVGTTDKPAEPAACLDDQFQCLSDLCIESVLVCDGRDDCGDGSDELNCHPVVTPPTTPSLPVETECTEREFRCNNDSKCIENRFVCDRNRDCADGSDEHPSICPALPACVDGQFQCNDGQCIDHRYICDGRHDCHDGSDESSPHCPRAPPACTPDQFTCRDRSCIDIRRHCDRRSDCPDGSDELDCVHRECSAEEFQCGDRSCIDRRRLCDNYNDCQDGSDESNCDVRPPVPACTSDQFTCHDHSCIDSRRRCDSHRDCPDGSDEISCDRCIDGAHRCGDATCINGAYRCDGRRDCSDGSDEQACECSSNEFRCGDGTCIDARRKCDQRDDCQDRSDEQNCVPTCNSHEFTCDSYECIDNRKRCDGYPDCRDSSDERNCGPVSTCRPDEFRCGDGSCIDQRRQCDTRPDCYDHSDERNCDSRCQPTQFRCQSGNCIDNRLFCNGQHDCDDGSDESQCALRGDILLRTYPDYQTIQQGREVVFQCRDEGTQRAPTKWSRLGHRSLPPNSTDVQGRLTMPNIQVDDSGVYVCTAEGVRGLDASHHDTIRKTANLTVDPYEPPTTRPPGICGVQEATCRNGQCIPHNYRCDGDFDCADGSDEISCRAPPESCQPNEFKCDNKNCVLKFWRCDGDDDCSDNSDEQLCAPANGTTGCQYREFKCQESDQCVPRSFQCDGYVDCQDGTDEIGCGLPTIIQPPVALVVVNIGDRVVLECVAVGVPVPVISWRLNWGHIPPEPRVTTTSDNGRGTLIIHSAVESDSGAYTCEAINSKGFVLGTPDANVQVRPGPSVCQPPYFNINAKGQSECQRCFCFSITEQCTSSHQFYERLPHGTEITIVTVPITPSNILDFDGRTTSTLNQDLIAHHHHNREFSIDRNFILQAPSNIFFWSLPSPFLDNKLGSYGGYLRYTINTEGSSRISVPDVIIKGNRLTLYYQGLDVQSGFRSDREIHFWEGVWRKLNPRNQPHHSDSIATREEIMTVLQRLDSIWIRASYFHDITFSSLIDLQLDVAVSESDGRERAVFVEQCTCPPGYTGLSCESCASGYNRVNTGRHLGECRRSTCDCHGHSDHCDAARNCHSCQHDTEGPRCERCRPGYYGDARRGTAHDCQPCQCPLAIPSNQFSRTCVLDPDGQHTCNACAPGYIGRHCEQCEAGYHGSPTIPGSGCTKTRSPCSEIGSISPLPDPRTGLCHCKDFVAGPTCSQCQPDKFHLNPHSLTGCISCFCMGVASECSSSNLFRSEVSVSFGAQQHDFAITSLDVTYVDADRLRVNSQTRELSFSDFGSLPRGGKMYYWKLPKLFLGNKLTSYGGNLTYTVRYSASSHGSAQAGPDVQIMGNRINLDHTRNTRLDPDTTETVTVPLFERYWKRSDGQPATREHLMMALADLDNIIIKAMYNSEMIESSLLSVKLETSTEYDNNQRRAGEVEQCRCPIGYKGTSCEECDVGYARTSGGLYLGLCEPCFCNGHSSDCDPDTGICRNCQHETTGDFCEQCISGHGDASRGTPTDCVDTPAQCKCDEKGTADDACSSINRCICKRNVGGDNCDVCAEGYYNLEAQNHDGCSKCFCFGVVNECSSSAYYRTTIYPTSNQGFSVTDRYQRTIIESGVNVNINGERNEIQFRGFDTQDPSTILYFSLPSQFTGNRLNSYGAKISFSLRYIARREGQPFQDSDIIINGNNLNLLYVNKGPLQPDGLEYYDVELTESHWQAIDSRSRGPTTREQFMTALSNVQSILIRASHSSMMIETVLADVRVGSATPQFTNHGLANQIEVCQCPPGYIGLSCEDCAPGYVRDSRGSSDGHKGACIPCNCHGHSDICDPNSRTCQRCRHNTVGPNCERCAEGYYGDATVGSIDDCKPCPCPLTIPSNQFTRSCYLDTDGQPTCQGCPIAYTGRTCDQCAPGYTGNPRNAGEMCRPSGQPSTTIIVRITEPKHRQVYEGETITFTCIGYSQVRDVTYNLAWTRDDGRPLPVQAQDSAGVLTIRDVHVDDSGTYVCTGSDLYGVATDKAVLRVSGSFTSTPVARIDQTTLEIDLGQLAEFRCHATGSPRPSITWTRGYNSPLSPSSLVQDGVLRIQPVSKSDEGEYKCVASNPLGTDEARAVLFVKDGGIDGRLRVHILPSNVDARIGETVRFDCRVEGGTSPQITWTRAAQPLPAGAAQIENMLVLSSVEEHFRGIYVCTATSREGTSEAQASLNVKGTDRPTARIDPEKQTVAQGSSVDLNCQVTGDPTPTVEWSKSGESLPANHQIIGTTLKLYNLAVLDRGFYLCRAENDAGQEQASTLLEVERREPPALELYPGNSQTIEKHGHALFQCRVTAGAPSPTIEWAREDRQPFASTVQELEGGVLRFTSVTGDEQGRYVCTVRNVAGTVTGIATLVIQGLPEISLFPTSPYSVTVGQSVRLNCYAKGDPEPSVLWKSTKHTSIPSPGGSVLEIKDVQQSDSGNYECVAHNSAGQSQETLQLIVSPGHAPLPTPEREFVVNEGNKAELRCNVQGEGSSEVTIRWIREDRAPMPADHSLRNGALILHSVNREDAGSYACLGIVNDTVRFSILSRLVVVAPPRIQLSPLQVTAHPGELVTVRCQATGDEPVQIEWRKEHGVIGRSGTVVGGDLVFREISTEDAGRYVCMARNHVGSAEGTIEILINGGCLPDPQCAEDQCQSLCSGIGPTQPPPPPPAPTRPIPSPVDFVPQQLQTIAIPSERPVINVHRRNQTVLVGSNVDFVCEVRGYPLPNILWSRDRGELLPMQSRIEANVLRILRVRVEDGGRYTCTATNEAGSSSDYAILNVQGMSPLVTSIEPSLTSVQPGDNLEVKCAVSGDPSATVTWNRDGGSFPYNARVVGNSLVFNNVQLNNAGTYRCQIHAYTGSYQEYYHLTFQNIPSLPQSNQVDTVSAQLGQSAVLNCKSDHISDVENTIPGSSVSYGWAKQGGVMSPNATIRGSQLIIPESRVDDAGTYVCTISTAPHSSLEVPIVLTVTGVVPHFAQAPKSYIALPMLPDAYLILDIEVSFKPETPDGLILYNGQKGGGEGDFVSLGMSRGHVEFRFDVGAGPAVLRSQYPVELSKWHTVKLHRNRKEGQMTVIGQPPVNGSAGGRFQGLDLIEPLYLGNVPDFSAINKLSGFDRGFVGCISRLNIAGAIHDLSRDFTGTRVGVTTCETCAVNPCTNRGVCQEALTSSGYKCLCQTGFSGLNCEKIGESCYQGICGNGRCVDKPEGFQCHCAFGKAGKRCEKDVSIYELAFRDDAYVAYPTPKTLKMHAFNLRVKPRSLKDGLIIYSAQSESGSGDFLSLAMKDKRIEFRFDTGSGAVILRSNQEIKENEWATIKVERNLREGTLSVNDEVTVRGKSPGITRGLNLRVLLYVGGVDKQRVNIAPLTGVTDGFDGCISELEVSGNKLDMVNAHVDSSNVDDCGGHAPCERHPCLNGGLCTATGNSPNDYVCECEEGFSGKNCEEEDDICNVISPCQNGGTCVGTASAYQCNCVLGYTGTHCDTKASFTESASFQGNGYIELSRDLLPHISSSVDEVIEIEFATKQPNGIILWHGQKPETDGKGQDYVTLAVSNGYLVFGYELGSGPAIIRSPSKVDDGKRHRVVLKRMGKDGSLELDGIDREYGEAPGVHQMLNARGNIYIGGLPNIHLMTAGQYKDGFIGCIDKLNIQPHGVINLMQNAIGGTNVASCDSGLNEEDYSGSFDNDNGLVN